MKRADILFERITDLENLKLAYLKALKDKRYPPAALIYGNKVVENLFSLKVQLENEIYNHGKYRQIKIYDPKERIITAASFEDRIIHHATMLILEPVFEKQFISHIYACRKGKGTHKAIEYASKKAKQCEYFLIAQKTLEKGRWPWPDTVEQAKEIKLDEVIILLKEIDFFCASLNR